MHTYIAVCTHRIYVYCFVALCAVLYLLSQYFENANCCVFFEDSHLTNL